MAVGPIELKRVAADRLDLVELGRASGDELDLARVALTPRAGAVPAQDLVRIDALVPVAPLDLADLRSAG